LLQAGIAESLPMMVKKPHIADDINIADYFDS